MLSSLKVIRTKRKKGTKKKKIFYLPVSVIFFIPRAIAHFFFSLNLVSYSSRLLYHSSCHCALFFQSGFSVIFVTFRVSHQVWMLLASSSSSARKGENTREKYHFVPRGAAAPPRGTRHVSMRYRQVPLGHLPTSAWGMPRRRHDARGSRCVGSTIREGGDVPDSPLRGLLLERNFFFTAQTFYQQLCLAGHEMPAWGYGAHRSGIPSRSTRPVEPSPARERCGETRTRSRAYSKVRDTRLAHPSRTRFSHFARFRDLAGGAQKRGRLDARHANHANLRPTSSPFVAWTRFVAARALENGPRLPRAPPMAARDATRFFESQTVNCFTCETTDDSYR